MNLHFSAESQKVFRILSIIFFFAVPLLTYFETEFNSLFILTVIFLGIGFSDKPKWVLFLITTVGVFIRIMLSGEYDNLSAIAIRLFVYLVVTYISSEVVRQHLALQQQKKEFILSLAKSLDSRDHYTGNHSENVANYALTIAKEMKLSKKQCDDIYCGGLLHDIGKIGIPESILNKPGKLTDEEYAYIKLHTNIGYETLKYITSFKNDGILDMVQSHHERYDGKGYPNGLKGEQIPISARIMALADSFDAMTSTRVYKKHKLFNEAILEIEKNKGKQFDPDLADVFLRALIKCNSNSKNQP
ncbi:HD-GYP domain-containing protein [Bacillus marasmi]|uniref:HD-GYP domain-containing protein n=1 Tax=Bacillus marasmi TaxID=1926279 RepID=UPI0011C71ADD|nr:HD-GYP domain-containing protein [Bacillus marasmi]